MKTETEMKRSELYVSECCLFETTTTKGQTTARCLMNLSAQKLVWFHRILHRFLTRPLCVVVDVIATAVGNKVFMRTFAVQS
jgi:hypothetical protein